MLRSAVNVKELKRVEAQWLG